MFNSSGVNFNRLVRTTLAINQPLHVDLVIEYVCMDKPKISRSLCNAVIQNTYTRKNIILKLNKILPLKVLISITHNSKIFF